MIRIFQHSLFILRNKYCRRPSTFLRKLWLRFLGMKVGRNTRLPKLFITWPHQVSLGSNCNLESYISFKFDGIWKPGPSIIVGDRTFLGFGCEFNIRRGISIGSDSLIASGCKFIDHDHGMSSGSLVRLQYGTEMPISIGNDVWMGCNVIVLKGVSIGDGAVVAAGAVVTKSILPKEIWAGIPAKKIGARR